MRLLVEVTSAYQLGQKSKRRLLVHSLSYVGHEHQDKIINISNHQAELTAQERRKRRAVFWEAYKLQQPIGKTNNEEAPEILASIHTQG